MAPSDGQHTFLITLVGAVGVVGLIYFAGGALVRVEVHHSGLPTDEVIAAIPREKLIVIGIKGLLAPAAGVAAGVLLAYVGFDWSRRAASASTQFRESDQGGPASANAEASPPPANADASPPSANAQDEAAESGSSPSDAIDGTNVKPESRAHGGDGQRTWRAAFKRWRAAVKEGAAPSDVGVWLVLAALGALAIWRATGREKGEPGVEREQWVIVAVVIAAAVLIVSVLATSLRDRTRDDRSATLAWMGTALVVAYVVIYLTFLWARPIRLPLAVADLKTGPPATGFLVGQTKDAVYIAVGLDHCEPVTPKTSQFWQTTDRTLTRTSAVSDRWSSHRARGFHELVKNGRTREESWKAAASRARRRRV